MYRVSYINSNGIITHKVGFATEIEARKWIEENKEQNKILKIGVGTTPIGYLNIFDMRKEDEK